ncbi:MAG: hypothetical protein QOJ50_2189, partial [Cryptosporangiaceae bacterium]|nr:hypothetical protein [Cryptosporangiaceae bacterium]
MRDDAVERGVHLGPVVDEVGDPQFGAWIALSARARQNRTWASGMPVRSGKRWWVSQARLR